MLVESICWGFLLHMGFQTLRGIFYNKYNFADIISLGIWFLAGHAVSLLREILLQ